MMNEHVLTHPISQERDVAAPWLPVIAVAGALALGAMIRLPLPFTPVPLTLQTFVVLAAPYLVGRWNASMGAGLFMALGLGGAPLFAAGGPTLGFIASWIALPWLMTLFRHPAAGLAAGTALMYVMGAGWLAYWANLTAWQAVTLGVAPFVAGDALKAAAAYGVIRKYGSHRIAA